MLPIGTKAETSKGHSVVVCAVFADGGWARKFVECPWCNRRTWEVDVTEADLTEDSDTQYLTRDELGQWRVVDAAVLRPYRESHRPRRKKSSSRAATN